MDKTRYAKIETRNGQKLFTVLWATTPGRAKILERAGFLPFDTKLTRPEPGRKFIHAEPVERDGRIVLENVYAD